MLALLKPILLTGLKSKKFKQFVVDLLEKLVESTDNELDDRALQIVKKGLDIELKEQENNSLTNYII